MSPHRNLISSIAALEPVASSFAFTMSANAEADADTYAAIGFDELRRTSNAINNATFEPIKVYGLVALIFFILCFPLTQYAKMLEARQIAH